MTDDRAALVGLYPEFARHGGLAGLLREVASRQGLQVKIVGYDELRPPMSPYWATCGIAPRASSVTVAIDRRRFDVPLWDQGVELGTCLTADAGRAVSVLAAWAAGTGILELAAANRDIVVLKPCAAAYVDSPAAYARCCWRQVLEAKQLSPQFMAFAKLAMEGGRLSALVPSLSRMSRGSLRFSESCGYPYATADVWLEGGGSDLVLHDGAQVVAGLDAAEALRLVENRLPASFGPAKYGTAKDQSAAAENGPPD